MTLPLGFNGHTMRLILFANTGMVIDVMERVEKYDLSMTVAREEVARALIRALDRAKEVDEAQIQTQSSCPRPRNPRPSTHVIEIIEGLFQEPLASRTA